MGDPEAERYQSWQSVRARAILVGQRLDLKAFSRSSTLALAPLTVTAGSRGVAVLFRYGVVVLFNLQAVEEAAFVAALKAFIEDPAADPEEETIEIRVATEGEERIDAEGVVHLRSLSVEHLQLIADALAKSVILASDEGGVARAFDRIEPVAMALRQSRRETVPSQQLLHHIGDVLLTQHRVVGRVEVTEKPDLLWDHPELERLYLRLQEEYELPERDRALSRKLNLISQTATTALALVQNRRSLRVEWYIVILIVVEIVLTLYELFLARPH
jgi:uncharacterized Rmd1/YagE family protein